jgi:hypothetical protein
MSYEDDIREQIEDFETPRELHKMNDAELFEYALKMGDVAFRVNVYGPERCHKFNRLARHAYQELVNRIKEQGWTS